jgi:hypothetical protein
MDRRTGIMWKAIFAAAAAVGFLAACGEDVKAKATTPAVQAAPAAQPAAEPAAAAPAQAAPAAEEKKETAEAKPDKDKLPGEQNQ